jgi:hypothetical protein
MTIDDVYTQNRRLWARLREKGQAARQRRSSTIHRRDEVSHDEVERIVV